MTTFTKLSIGIGFGMLIACISNTIFLPPEQISLAALLVEAFYRTWGVQ